jgi:hypothetical protein
MENLLDVIEAAKGIGKSQKAIVESLFKINQSLPESQRTIVKSLFEAKASLSIKFFSSDKIAISKLLDKGIVQIKEDQISLTELGRGVYYLCQGKYDGEVKSLNDIEKKQRGDSSKLTERKQAKLEKSNQFLELYKQGLNRQEIGDKYGVSRERVRQLLDSNPAFHLYLKDREEAEVLAEIEKRENAQKRFYAKSLAALYPERVAELWDYDKNGDLKPEEVPAGSTQHQIWLKCSLDGHSWNKKPNDIKLSWTRSGTSGCPICIGRKKKKERQPALTDVYSELIIQYWDYEKIVYLV